MKRWSVLIALFLATVALSAYECRDLIDVPTAGILQRGEASVSSKLYRDSGLVVGAQVGLFPRFMFGVTYGGEKIVGNEQPAWHELPGVNVKLRFLDETANTPAVAIGFDNQGHGAWNKELRRYDIKSKGFYLTSSKNFDLLGNLGVHGGLNLSTEDREHDKDLDAFLGVDKNIGEMITGMLEYDLATNDNYTPDQFKDFARANRGYLNGGVLIRFTDELMLKFYAYDMLKNNHSTYGMDRAVMLIYNMQF